MYSRAASVVAELISPALIKRLRAAQLAGHDVGDLIGQITAAPMDRAPVHL